MDRKQALTRIVELAMRWQASCNWSAGFKSADSFRKHREQSEIDGAVVWKNQRKIDELTTSLKSRRLSKDERTELKAELASQQAFADSETFEGFKHGSERHQELSEECHSRVRELYNEFIELKTLLRQFAPTLLQYVPDAHFFEACPDGFSSQTREMKTLEGAVRAMMTTVTMEAVRLIEPGDKQETTPEAEVNLWKQAREQNTKITIADQMVVLFKNDDSIVDRKGLSDEVARILDCSPQSVRHPNNATWRFYRTEQARRKKTRQDLEGKRWTESEQNDADD